MRNIRGIMTQPITKLQQALQIMRNSNHNAFYHSPARKLIEDAVNDLNGSNKQIQAIIDSVNECQLWFPELSLSQKINYVVKQVKSK